MKFKPELILILILSACVYDPPPKGKEISIHNQTDKPIIILDSLSENHPRLYDTAIVNGRKYINRQPNYITEYGVYQRFYSYAELNSLKNNKITLYIVDTIGLHNKSSETSLNHSFRSFEISTDTLKRHNLNHLFITSNTIIFEHDYNYTDRQK